MIRQDDQQRPGLAARIRVDPPLDHRDRLIKGQPPQAQAEAAAGDSVTVLLAEYVRKPMGSPNRPTACDAPA